MHRCARVVASFATEAEGICSGIGDFPCHFLFKRDPEYSPESSGFLYLCGNHWLETTCTGSHGGLRGVRESVFLLLLKFFAVGGCGGGAGVTSKRLSEMYVAMGDLGDVAEKCKSNQRTLLPHPHLTVGSVFARLQDVAACKGARSAQRKQGIIAGLLRAARCAVCCDARCVRAFSTACLF